MSKRMWRKAMRPMTHVQYFSLEDLLVLRCRWCLLSEARMKLLRMYIFSDFVQPFCLSPSQYFRYIMDAHNAQQSLIMCNTSILCRGVAFTISGLNPTLNCCINQSQRQRERLYTSKEKHKST